MKIIKNGFTLAEILLCLAVIGIVTAMGITISKYSTERAYQKYYQTGYETLYNIISEHYNDSVDYSDSNNGNYLMKLVADDIDGATRVETEVTAPNGIKYNLTQKTDNGEFIQITMTVPQQKSGSNRDGTATTRLIYIPNDQLLIPVDLLDRVDLLPFYVNSGDGNAPVKMSFAQAFKQAYNGNNNYQYYNVPKCMLYNVSCCFKDHNDTAVVTGFFYNTSVNNSKSMGGCFETILNTSDSNYSWQTTWKNHHASNDSWR